MIYCAKGHKLSINDIYPFFGEKILEKIFEEIGKEEKLNGIKFGNNNLYFSEFKNEV